MATQEELEAQIAAIERTLNTGVTRFDVSGVSSTTRDLSALRTRLSELRGQLAALTTDRPMTRQIRTYSTKGY